MKTTTAIMLAVLALFITSINSANAALTDDLVGYYDGEDNNNDPAASHPDALTNVDVGVGVAGGIVGNTFEFDDTQNDVLRAETSYSATVASDLGDSFTVAAWYNLDVSAVLRDSNRHFVWENADDFDFSYWVDQLPDPEGGADLFANQEMFVDDATTTFGKYQKGTWEHVAQTISTVAGVTTVSTYINGAFVGSDDGPTATLGNISAVTGLESPGINFGRARNQASDRPFDGKIDEIGIWSRVLSDGEIAGAYNLGLNGLPLTVPEPSSLLLGLGSLVALGLRRRK